MVSAIRSRWQIPHTAPRSPKAKCRLRAGSSPAGPTPATAAAAISAALPR